MYWTPAFAGVTKETMCLYLVIPLKKGIQSRLSGVSRQHPKMLYLKLISKLTN